MPGFVLIDLSSSCPQGLYPVHGWGATLREAVKRAESCKPDDKLRDLHAVHLTPGALAFCQTARCYEDIATGLEYNDAAEPVVALYRANFAEHLRKLCTNGLHEALSALETESDWHQFLRSTAQVGEPDHHYTALCEVEAAALRMEIRTQLGRGKH